MTVRRALTTAVLALAAWCAAAAPAHAQDRQRWRSCFGDLECTRLAVPLDRSGGVRGTVSLRVTRGEFAGRRADHLMYLSGGPGGAGIFEMIDVLLTVPSLLDRFNVIGFDQRGTGASGLLRCPAIERDGRLRSTVGGRAVRGAARRAAGVLHDARLGRGHGGDPQGARRAEAHAVRDLLRHDARARLRARVPGAGRAADPRLRRRPRRQRPVRARRLPGDAADAARRSAGPAACRGDPAADLSALVARLRPTPLRGEVFTAGGKRRRQAVDPVAIADLLYDADYLPALRAGVPAAVRAALAGDAAPLLRLLRISAGFAVPSHPADFSAARYAAVCEETPLPWPRGTPLGRPPARRPRGRRGARAGGVLPVRRADGVRRRDRAVPALARPGAAGAARGRRLPGRAGAAAPGRGGPADAARGLGARSRRCSRGRRA